MARLRGETKAGVEFVRDVASGERLVASVAERAPALALIRKSLIWETSLLTPAA